MMSTPTESRLVALDARIEREILRLRARYELSLDEFRGLYVSDEHVDRLLADAQPETSAQLLGPLDRPAAAFGDVVPRWRGLVEAFELSALDEDLLVIAAAPELDLKYETLYAYLNNDITRKWPTADLARRLLTDVAGPNAVTGALAPGASLHERHLVQRIDPPSGRPALLNAGFALHPYVAQWLHGQAASRALDTRAITWTSYGDLTGVPDRARSRAEPIVRLLEHAQLTQSSLPIVALVGQPGSGRTTTAMAAAAATGRALVCVDLVAMSLGDQVAGALEHLSVALALEPAIVVIEGFETVSEEEPARWRHEARVSRALARWPRSAGVVFRTAAGERWRVCAGARRVIEVRCDADPFGDRVAQWRAAVRTCAPNVAEAELPDLAGRFALTPGQVIAALATARDLATMQDEPASATLVAAAARLASDQSLGRLAVKVERMHDWPDLVLPPLTLRRLRELAAAIRHRHVVYGEWGFGERVITGTGIKALFAGSSGTGKTMAAGVIARELGLDLYKVDLAGVISKYIGETEKNLDRIFRAARSSNAIVFLDEADAIMGKRSEVKDAHDRYANIEVAYLLQRLEDHDGVVILATNMKRNIDDAFNRRMQYVVDFARPEEKEREQIWRRMFPPRAPLAADVDFTFLSHQFDLAGGDIRNVALDAAFLAAQDGGVIDMRAIVDALSRQLAKQGKTPTGTDFRQYQKLMPAPAGRRDGR